MFVYQMFLLLSERLNNRFLSQVPAQHFSCFFGLASNLRKMCKPFLQQPDYCTVKILRFTDVRKRNARKSVLLSSPELAYFSQSVILASTLAPVNASVLQTLHELTATNLALPIFLSQVLYLLLLIPRMQLASGTSEYSLQYKLCNSYSTP